MADLSKGIGGPSAGVRSIDLELVIATLLRGIVVTPIEGKPDSQLLAKCLRYLFEQFLMWMEYVPVTAFGPPPIPRMRINFDTWIKPNFMDGKLCSTRNGQIGLVPAAAKPSDSICVVLASSVPFVLRNSHDKEDAWQHIGTCYFYHVIAGEVV